MKNLFLLLIALIAIAFILVKVFVSTPEIIPEVIPENSVPVIATSTPVEVTPGSKQVTLSLGQRTTYNDIIIEVFALKEDSRCASDVQCVWAGRVVVALNILSLEGEHILSKELEERAFFYAGSTKITLEKVDPYPVSTRETGDGDYRFELLLEVIE